MRIDILERKDEIVEWISINQSKAFMCKQFKCKPETLNSYLTKMGLEYVGNQGAKGIKSDKRRILALDYAKTDSCRSAVLKIKLVEEGYLENICVKCGNEGEWLGESITLELDHIDGDRFNNDLKNLRILCPNCHSQTPTFRGRGNIRKKISYCECGNKKQKNSKCCITCYNNR